MTDEKEEHVRPRMGRVRKTFLFAWLLVRYIFDRLEAAVIENGRIIGREKDLFLGTALVLIGFFSFESDKYCDGNTADYLSCTRPSTYYYFDWLDMTLLVVGAFFILLWFMKRRRIEG